MLLTIIDISSQTYPDYSIKVELEEDGETQCFVVKNYGTPFSENYRDTLNWYFKGYIESNSYYMADKEPKDKGVTNNIVTFGKFIGDELHGEDHQLEMFSQVIEDAGIQNLKVEIVSSRIEFFSEFWETMILPQSKYVLSTVSQEFVRKLVLPNHDVEYPELRLSLQTASPSIGTISQLDQECISRVNAPLRILYWVSRPGILGVPEDSGYGYSLSLEAMRTEGAVEYTISQVEDLDHLEALLTDEDQPIHIMHYDGPIYIEDDTVKVATSSLEGEEKTIDVKIVIQKLVENEVAILSIDAKKYMRDSIAVPAQYGLASIASVAEETGLGNVIGLSHVADPWVSKQCFQSVYDKLLSGLTLGQAVVEARKALQSQFGVSFLSIEPLPFHRWPLLVHYGGQPVTFFDSTQVTPNVENSEMLQCAKEKLLGFRSDMLPPLVYNVNEHLILLLASRFESVKRQSATNIVSVVGPSGCGKTQLVHLTCMHFSQKKIVDYAFYFDFKNDFYSSENIIEMIIPVLMPNLPSEDIGKYRIRSALRELRCCFVLDNFLQGGESFPEISWKTKNDLENLFSELLAQGHFVVFTGCAETMIIDFSSQPVFLDNLSSVEQKLIAMEELKRLQLSDNMQDFDLDRLLVAANGNPLIAKKLMRLLNDQNVEELIPQLEREIGADGPEFSVLRFYKWQWERLPLVWKRLLVMCSEVDGLLLEMVMVACDQKSQYLPAKKFLKLLDDESILSSVNGKDGEVLKVRDGIAFWQKAGFLRPLANGHIVDSDCLQFINQKNVEMFGNSEDENRLLYFSQVVCEGVRILSQHVIDQNDPDILHNLLMNRRSWVEHFERLWFSGDLEKFIEVKNCFDQLLKQAGLEQDGERWALDLLGRSPSVASIDRQSIGGKHSWLALAIPALNLDESLASKTLLEGVSTWTDWLKCLKEDVEKKDIILLHQAGIFLSKYYQNTLDWNTCVLITKKMHAVYLYHEAWPMVIQALKNMTSYYIELGKLEEALAIEEKILNDIPYSDSPPGYKAQQMLHVVLARILRKETFEAQQLLNQLRSMTDAEKMRETLDGIQADIHYSEGKYLEAFPYYCDIWLKLTKLDQKPQIDQLRERMMVIEEKLGREKFDALFLLNMDEFVISPRDYEIGLNVN